MTAPPSMALMVAGQPLLEYQIRLARVCGGIHIVVLVEQLPSAMVALFDRLRADGIDIDIARDARDAADRFHPDEMVLLLTPGLVPRRSLIDALVGAGVPTLVSVAEAPEHQAFERIDARDRWTGLALLRGQTIRDTAAMLGDWSISSTLMRRALQSDATCHRLPDASGIAMITDAQRADMMSVGLVHDAQDSKPTLFDSVVVLPLARQLVPLLQRKAVPTDLIGVMPLVLGGSAFLLSVLGWFSTAFALLLLGSFVDGCARLMHRAAVRDDMTAKFRHWAGPALFCAVLLFLGWDVSQRAGDWVGLLLSAWLLSLFLLRPANAEAQPVWAPTLESNLLVMLMALVLAVPVAGILVLVVHGLAARTAERYFWRAN